MGIAVVLLERRICKVGGAAQIADIGALHFRMQLHMTLQIRFERKAIMANVALEEIVSLVHTDDVLIEGILRGKVGAAYLADCAVSLVARLFEMLLQLLLRQLQAAFPARKHYRWKENERVSNDSTTW